MPGYVVIVGTLDTKGDQVKYLKNKIEVAGKPTCVIDIGVVGDPWFKPTYDHEQVARAAGTSIEDIIALGLGQGKMGEGAANIVREMHAKGEVSGIVGMGGTRGTNVSLRVLRAVPLGVPKLLMTTVAYSPAMIPELVGGDDLMMLPWIGGLYGINSMAKRILETAAGAIAGAAKAYDQRETGTKKVVGIQALGTISYPHLNRLRPALEGRGYEVAVFHATGMSGRAMEKAISDGLIAVSLDLQAGVELLNEVTGGVFSAGAHRLEAAGNEGIPQIVSPGAIWAFHWAKDRPLPAKYRPRAPRWDSFLAQTQGIQMHSIVRSNADEIAAVGKLMAEKLNMAKGPAAVVIAKQMRSGQRSSDAIFLDAASLEYQNGITRFIRNMKRKLKPGIEVEVLETSYDDPIYSDTVLSLFDEMTKN